jgi:CHAD domain-containing protein
LQRHALRIAIKRQRYATEFFAPLFADSEGKQRKYARYLMLLQQAQDSLGRINDTRVARERLTAAQVEAGAMEAFVLGWLAAQLANIEPDSETTRLVREWLKLPVYW